MYVYNILLDIIYFMKKSELLPIYSYNDDVKQCLMTNDMKQCQSFNAFTSTYFYSIF